MDGLPDPQEERHLQARLRLVVSLRNLDLDRDSFLVLCDLAEIGDAVGTPKKAEEFLSQRWIAKANEQIQKGAAEWSALTLFDQRRLFK